MGHVSGVAEFTVWFHDMHDAGIALFGYESEHDYEYQAWIIGDCVRRW